MEMTKRLNKDRRRAKVDYKLETGPRGRDMPAGSTGLGGQGRGWDKELSGECGTGIGGGVRQSRGEGVGLGEGGGRGEGGSKSGGRGGRLLRA